jgi:DNA-binding NarL/FixJ family response regulator
MQTNGGGLEGSLDARKVMAQGSKRPRVLLADDHAGMQIAVRRLLSPSCDVVGCILDAASLIDAVAKLRPEVVLLDLSLPGGLRGFDVCELITSRTPEVKVVIFTGHDDANLESRAREAGASGYVWKLRATDQLLRTIHAVVDGTPALAEPLGAYASARNEGNADLIGSIRRRFPVTPRRHCRLVG